MAKRKSWEKPEAVEEVGTETEAVETEQPETEQPKAIATSQVNSTRGQAIPKKKTCLTSSDIKVRG